MAESKSRRTKRVIIRGIVQGVGFRPFVLRLALEYHINGRVRNLGSYVELLAQGDEEQLRTFFDAIQKRKPLGSEITEFEIEDTLADNLTEFRIVSSDKIEGGGIRVSPDLPICEDCHRELYDPDNRRFRHPFISCASCGPRYTIMESLPYDRHTTVMKDFPMCPQCAAEYHEVSDRRSHAQTISCHTCGPYAILVTQGESIFREDAMARAAQILKDGGILAVKGIGGYHYACSPFSEESVRNLRDLKGREHKPFAVMFPNLTMIEEYCSVNEDEKQLLVSPARPIVLMRAKESDFAPNVANKSLLCGAFLPYTPMQALLLEECGPLIMTSANRSDMPIIINDNVMLAEENPLLQGVLYSTRRILRGLDDSVVRVVNGKTHIIRRARGYAPRPVEFEKKQINIYAAGGDLKASFSLYQDGLAYISQYLGDLEEQSCMEVYRQSVDDIAQLFQAPPAMAVCDLHPNYHSVRFARSLALPVIEVQHHHAHIASVMAEHQLDDPVIGVSFDGTGYGTDGAVWGGEFLLCKGAEVRRIGHLEYIECLGGDGMSKDASRTAACYLHASALDECIEDDRYPIIKTALEQHINTIQTSSMGRLFDTVAVLLRINRFNNYEGECAIMLENSALLAREAGVSPCYMQFDLREADGMLLPDPSSVLHLMSDALGQGKPVGAIALGFHQAIAQMSVEVCIRVREQTGVNSVALSGGVFQNALLCEMSEQLLSQNGFRVYANHLVPSNDGGICLGQIYIALKSEGIPCV